VKLTRDNCFRDGGTNLRSSTPYHESSQENYFGSVYDMCLRNSATESYAMTVLFTFNPVGHERRQ